MKFNPHNPTIKKLAEVAIQGTFLPEHAEEECVIQAMFLLQAEGGVVMYSALLNSLRRHREDLSETSISIALRDLVDADVLRLHHNVNGYCYSFTLEFLKLIRDIVKKKGMQKLDEANVFVQYTIKGITMRAAEFRKFYNHAKNYIALVSDDCIGGDEDQHGIFWKGIWFDFIELCVFVKKVEDEELIQDKIGE